MRRASFILLTAFVTGVVFPHRYMFEVLRIPALVHHLMVHLAAGDDLHHFFTEHYGGAARNDHSDPDHERLPFHGQHRDAPCCTTTAMVVPVDRDMRWDPPRLPVHVTMPDDPLLPRSQGVSIWRPPKSA
ncbi:MAG: hypothetical protein KDB97_14465 [Flavobacteriales bacterium]|nr:hypothetical protein [Flavobacteriales bacterium]